jgi:hypothetical protein
MIICELGQAWKGAAAAKDSCAEVRLKGHHPQLFLLNQNNLCFIR